MPTRYDYPAPAGGDGRERIPPGATRRASDRTARPGGIDATPLDDRHAAGTPGGGTEVGGLGGTNLPDGSPEDLDLATPMATGAHPPEADEDEPPYSGASGGAVGGTPAEGRAKGGRGAMGGLRPGGGNRGDTTVGGDPEQET